MKHIKACEALNITRKELAEILGISKATIDSWSDSSRMSKTTEIALDLMVENHKLRDIFTKIQELQNLINSYKEKSNSNICSKSHRALIERIKFIIDEFKIHPIELAKAMNETSFKQLDDILNFKIYPDFNFLDKFVFFFKISEKWLLTGEKAPFDSHFITSNYMSEFLKEAERFNQIYIVTCEDNNNYTRIVAKLNNQYDVNKTYFCIGKNYWMEWRERNDLCDLYEFYKRHKHNTRLIQLTKEDYDNLFSNKYYSKNILENGEFSNMLNDLFNLDIDMIKEYDDFYRENIEIIKQELEQRKKKAQTI